MNTPQIKTPRMNTPRMKRLDAIQAIYPQLEKCVLVTIMGAVAVEMQSIGHRPNFFYLQHAMGLASSIGLGIALARPELKVVVFDGDGSILMNLGALTTMARCKPDNLVHVVFDNENLISVGGYPSATAAGCDLEAIAAGSGVPRTLTVRSIDEFTQRFDEALHGREMTTIIAKVEAVGPSKFVTDLSLLENRFQFHRWLRDGAAKIAHAFD